MKTNRMAAVAGAGVLFGCAFFAGAAPSLSVTKPPVILPTLMTGPPIDPFATQGQWFFDNRGAETVRTNEFHDETAGGLGANAITGYVDSVTYLGGPGTPIVGFSIQATIHNDTSVETGWAAGANSHGEQRPRVLEEVPYVGPLVDTKLAAEFAIGDTSRLPTGFMGPYREAAPFIEAVNEDQWGWYCWNPEDPNPEHKPAGGYFVPTWDFGTILPGQSASRQLVFSIAAPGLQPADPRYVAIVASFAATNDVLLGRSRSLKISTWIDDLALDLGAQQEDPPPLRLSDVSVFHNPYKEEEPEELDFGDAPDGPYPTLLANDGARHGIVPGVFMGAQVDAELDGQPNPTATGDDLANLADEDGVSFTGPVYAGQTVTVAVNCSTSGLLFAWVDFDANGSWGDFGENVVAASPPMTQGLNYVSFGVPAGAALGTTFARFRFTSLPVSMSYTGLVASGEVEDYQVVIQEAEEPELDFGDAPDSPYPTLLSSDGARHVVVPGIYMGALIDSEADGQPDPTAKGDDLANLADEDGVTFTGPVYAGQTVTVAVNCSTSGLLFAWVDFDANGSWGDFGENVVAASPPMTQGLNYVSFGVPASAALGTTFARFRFTTLPGSLTYTGRVANGEVEDYQVDILEAEEPELDFGDATDNLMIPGGYPTYLANNGARHTIVPGIFMGLAVDGEPDGQPDGTATGDDNNPPAGVDDEDGVTLPAMLAAGSTVPIQVVASVPGYLNAWIDWNCGGTWVDPGEHVFLNYPLLPGVNPLLLSVPLPPAFVAGGPESRWRFTTYPVAVPAFTGAETDGEVEDYEVRLEILDFGDAPDPAYPTLLANSGACHRIPSVYYLGAAAPDLDPDGQPTSDATGDDLAGADDEDGVFAGATLVRGDPSALLGVIASPSGYLNAWLDFNGDGDWADAGEQIAADLSLPAGVNPLPFAIPADAQVGPVLGRFRFSSLTNLSYVGFASDGEVEDHAFTIYQAGPDTNNFEITNIVYVVTNQATVWWVGDTTVVYETQYILDLPSTASPPWTAWGPWVTGDPLMQVDTNAAETAKHYRVVAPYSPPPP